MLKCKKFFPEISFFPQSPADGEDMPFKEGLLQFFIFAVRFRCLSTKVF